ncbi:MAG: aminopeptidase P family protein [Caldilineae bacterium]|nr:MAG: aminopeptidase P family protein [Caldilineae bacterium]
MSEFRRKLERIKALLQRETLDAVLLKRVSSFAWATCGAASYVNTAVSEGEASLLITPDHLYLFTNNIEATRLEQEEKLAEQGWEFRVSPWHRQREEISQLTAGLWLGADVTMQGVKDLGRALAYERSCLGPEEIERFRQLGKICAQAMNAAIRAVKPGMSEYEMAGLLAFETERRGAQAIVNLVASDERVFRFRHPLPTAKRMERYAMLVLCGRKDGLVCSITRLIHFGRLPDELRRKAEAVARVDAAFIQATRPGATLGEIFKRGQAEYAATGFADEWELHHQGGPAGYEPRELVATPFAREEVVVGQVYAWNPSITGAKSEDSILIGEEGNEVLTAIDDWPMLTVEVDGVEMQRPAILEIL